MRVRFCDPGRVAASEGLSLAYGGRRELAVGGSSGLDAVKRAGKTPPPFLCGSPHRLHEASGCVLLRGTAQRASVPCTRRLSF